MLPKWNGSSAVRSDAGGSAADKCSSQHLWLLSLFFIFTAAEQQADQSFTIARPLMTLRKTLQVAELIFGIPFQKMGRFITTDTKLAFLHYVDVQNNTMD